MTATAPRESFLDAQRRHRRQGWRWALSTAFVVAVLMAVIAGLLAPLIFVVVGLLCDLANLLVPMPDPLGAAGQWLAAVTDEQRSVPWSRVATLVAVAALPGMAMLGVAWWRLGTVSATEQADAISQRLGLRKPRHDDLEEIQMANLVDEMAIAAGIRPPAVYLLDDAAANLGAFGHGGRESLVVTRGLLDQLPRAPTQALVGQMLGAIGNGDALLTDRMLKLLGVVGMLMLLARAPMSANARTAIAPLFRLRPTSDAERGRLLDALVNPDGIADDLGKRDSSDKLGWRDWLMMPVMGSLMIGIIIVPIATLLLIAPLLGAMWRRRRLLADATAVQYTRDPQALADAYVALGSVSTRLTLKSPWLVNLFALDVMAASMIQVASPFPSLATRIERLNAMGAVATVPTGRGIPSWAWLLILPLAAMVCGLMGLVIVLGVWVSIMLNLLFLGIPASLLHCLLRLVEG